ncbi:MAG: hypothetical protein ACI9UO_002593 [Nitrospinales bacterium]|jgi:hypothetical protein
MLRNETKFIRPEFHEEVQFDLHLRITKNVDMLKPNNIEQDETKIT